MDDREQQRKIRHCLAVLRHAEEVTGNVAATCRYYGISRPTFYKCQEYTMQKMLEAVFGVRQLENGNQWMANEITDALDPTALTTAFMADRFYKWQTVKRVVGSKAAQLTAAAR